MKVLIIDEEASERKKVEDSVKRVEPDAKVVGVSDIEEAFEVLKKKREKNVRIKTFGEFMVFVGDRPVEFRYSKALELFALIVDRRGKPVGNGVIRNYLWPESDQRTDHSSYISTLKKEVMQVFTSYGAGGIIRQNGQAISIIPDMVECDFYDFINAKETASDFGGRYMEQYSWAEPTVGLLYSISQFRDSTLQ